MRFRLQCWSCCLAVSAIVVLLAALAHVVFTRTDGDHPRRSAAAVAAAADSQTTAATTIRRSRVFGWRKNEEGTSSSQLEAGTKKRPLGRNWMVDQNGTIWRGDHPVGYWGVNGGENPKVNRGTQRSGGAER